MSFGSRSLPPPTAEQKRRWERMRANSCVTCYLRDGTSSGALEIHHLTVGDRHGALRLGHDHTVCLCEWCHRGVHRHASADYYEREYGPSLALTPRVFRREYGDGAYLLKVQNEMIDWTKPPVRERRRKRGSQCTASANQVPRNWNRYESESQN